jgi:hypothetical protein
MYKNPRVYLQKVQSGWNLGNLIVSGSFLQKELDTRKYLKITIDHMDVNAKLPELHLLPLADGQRGTSRPNHRRSGRLGARVTVAGDRGDKGGLEEALTGGRGRQQQPNFGEGRTGGASSGRSVLKVMEALR